MWPFRPRKPKHKCHLKEISSHTDHKKKQLIVLFKCDQCDYHEAWCVTKKREYRCSVRWAKTFATDNKE